VFVLYGSYNTEVYLQQLIMVVHPIFRAIGSGECFNQSWADKNSDRSPNIKKLTAHFNRVSGWIAYEICNLPDLRDRCVVML